ncbi:Rieske (2Fe-2S) protein [Actinomadura rudentiformis]|uniref:Cytochrome bc1 complex Rieske iron-sulfur subunit n=2 Tax=Actinomadura rudentiformis TaxID=359158 RepID=A0A6H9YRJ2_9ACTN|nr:Rieske (2Fe-2S) protein [Actinomadura rudentiformis]
MEPASQVEEIEQSATAAPEGGNTRRGVLIGVGLAGAAGVVAACGGSDDSGDNGSAGQQSPTGGGGGAALAQASEIPVGGGKVFKDQKVVVVQPTQGTFKAFSAVCTHRSCPVDEVAGGTINCPCHGSKFKIADGSVAGGPATKPLEEKQVTVADGQIKLA